jgi:hypothetical protein
MSPEEAEKIIRKQLERERSPYLLAVTYADVC